MLSIPQSGLELEFRWKPLSCNIPLLLSRTIHLCPHKLLFFAHLNWHDISELCLVIINGICNLREIYISDKIVDSVVEVIVLGGLCGSPESSWTNLPPSLHNFRCRWMCFFVFGDCRIFPCDTLLLNLFADLRPLLCSWKHFPPFNYVYVVAYTQSQERALPSHCHLSLS